MKAVYSLFIGRYQPPHNGHEALIRTALDEGRNVLIAVRDTEKGPDNPLSITERTELFEHRFKAEIQLGTVKIISIQDINQVCIGRKVGYEIREIHLDKQTEGISGTRIRSGEKA